MKQRTGGGGDDKTNSVRFTKFHTHSLPHETAEWTDRQMRDDTHGNSDRREGSRAGREIYIHGSRAGREGYTINMGVELVERERYPWQESW